MTVLNWVSTNQILYKVWQNFLGRLVSSEAKRSSVKEYKKNSTQCFDLEFFFFHIWWKRENFKATSGRINSAELISNISCTFKNKIRSTPHTFHFARAIIPTQNAQLMAEAAEQFHKTGISCQTPCCYSCHRLACRERFTRQGRWLTDCWCLGQGCACFPLQEIHMNGASKGCSLDLYVVISAMPLRWNKHNIRTPTGVSQFGK